MEAYAPGVLAVQVNNRGEACSSRHMARGALGQEVHIELAVYYPAWREEGRPRVICHRGRGQGVLYLDARSVELDEDNGLRFGRARPNDAAWEVQLARLEVYRPMHGDCNVPRS